MVDMTIINVKGIRRDISKLLDSIDKDFDRILEKGTSVVDKDFSDRLLKNINAFLEYRGPSISNQEREDIRKKVDGILERCQSAYGNEQERTVYEDIDSLQYQLETYFSRVIRDALEEVYNGAFGWYYT